MWFPNAWFSKIGLLAVGALLWGGGAQAGTSVESLSQEDGVTCKPEELRSCLIYESANQRYTRKILYMHSDCFCHHAGGDKALVTGQPCMLSGTQPWCVCEILRESA